MTDNQIGIRLNNDDIAELSLTQVVGNQRSQFEKTRNGYCVIDQLVECKLEQNPLTPRQLDVRISESVNGFCIEHHLESHLDTAISIARKCFSTAASLLAEVEQDPDSEEMWITLTASVAGNVPDILACYNNYSSEWVASTPSPQRFMVRLALNVI